eukprot:CAMPEP_0176155238 /NCGR_PEP_ID=MMETSP0120_2-20121206/79320_1 /TAXON_ID=160619 /ORGANISM="Kryptoperidinium foliaceum, Strain CCMP 1326" /LENGTH=73 /DNA_ID=CAMNT_0017492373 /DNA_START=33 /DNA_END=250 /DNA_ORIENTATION=-
MSNKGSRPWQPPRSPPWRQDALRGGREAHGFTKREQQWPVVLDDARVHHRAVPVTLHVSGEALLICPRPRDVA